MKTILTLAAIVLLAHTSAAAGRAKAPADATVFVRLIGSVHAEIETQGVKQTVDMDAVEIGTGSGFIISPYGYVLTNDHVVSADDVVVTNGVRRVHYTLKVSRIQVCFPPEALAAGGLSTPCSDASVSAADPVSDLAVLFVSALNLPYVALGDSDVVTSGQPVDALGYPFGRQIEVGRGVMAPDLVPQISVTPGAVSAMRAGDTGERRYLQVTNVLNPGNSGGPLVDRDGFAVGVIRMKLEGGSGIGFAISVNEVKAFLESHGLDHLMPVHRFRLAPFQNLEGKGMGLRLAEGIADSSPFRTRVEIDAGFIGVALRVDRVFSPWNPKQIEQALVGTQGFELMSTAASQSELASRAGSAPLLDGHAAGTTLVDDQEARMDYAILDLGAEKLVARYVGPAEQLAYNEGVLRGSLASLEGRRMLAGDLGPVDTLEWSAATAADGQRGLPVPVGWVIEPGSPTPCPGLSKPSAVAAASPAGDYTVVLRAAVWSAGNIVPAQAALACSPRRGELGAASYVSRGDWLGVSYTEEGAFIRLGNQQVWQLEVLSPAAKSTVGHALLAAWVKKAAE